MKKKTLLILFGFLISFIILEFIFGILSFSFFFINDFLNKQKANSETKILCLGESTTIGMGDNSWPAQLEKLFIQRSKTNKFAVINKGLPLINSDYIVEQLPYYLKKYKPMFVICMMGINDSKTKYYEKIGNVNNFLFLNSKIYRFLKISFMNLIENKLNVASNRKKIGKIEKEIKKFPKNDILLVKLGLLYFLEEESKNNLLKAVKVLEKALEINKLNREAYGLLSGVYVKLSMNDQNDELLRKAINIFPSDSKILTSLVESFLEKSDLDGAREQIKLFIKNNPQSDFAYIKLGWNYFMKNDFQEAEKCFYVPILRNESNDFAYIELAKFFVAVNKLDKAKNALKKAIFINPNNSIAVDELKNLVYLPGEYINPRTYNNYHKIKDIVFLFGAKLVVMQYPIRSILPLKKIFKEEQGAYFVDNEQVFKSAVEKEGFNKYFVDKFAGDFGHCTLEGNKLIAENIFKEIFINYN